MPYLDLVVDISVNMCQCYRRKVCQSYRVNLCQSYRFKLCQVAD